MFVFRSGYAAVLLLALTENFVFASFENGNPRPEDFVKMIASSVRSTWIDRINLVLRNSSSPCAEEVTAVIEAIESGNTWALKMLDSSSKIQSGIMEGNFRDLGTYYECVTAKGQYNGTYIQGQHCTVSYGILSSAVCVPSSCNETDVAEILGGVIQNATEISELKLGINGVSCVPVEYGDLTTVEIVMIIVFSAIGVFIVFCTVCEFVKKFRPAVASSAMSQLAKFSLYANAKSILSTEVNPRMMPAIQGIRFFSMCWLTLGHRFVFVTWMALVNFPEVLDRNNSWDAVVIQASGFGIDTFFLISGFLMSYLFLKAKQSGKSTNFLTMYILRYIRLTPCFAAVMAFVTVLLYRISNGPLWNVLLTIYVKPCRKNWWLTLLYVQNLVEADEVCILQSWYLAVDMQLFWISPLLLYPLYRWPKWGVRILGLFLIGSVITPAVVLAVNGYSNSLTRLDAPVEKRILNFLLYHTSTYNRGFVYFAGILLGYDTVNRKRHFTPVNVMTNWIVACILMLVCVLAMKPVYDLTSDYNVALETTFAVLLRPLWAIAIAWVVYACTQGYGGPVTRFLSLPIFQPLSRLSYAIYLVHMVIQVTSIAAAQISSRYSDIAMLNYFLLDIFWSIVIGFIVSLFFESPIIVLQKMLTKSDREGCTTRESKKEVDGIDNTGMTEVHSHL